MKRFLFVCLLCVLGFSVAKDEALRPQIYETANATTVVNPYRYESAYIADAFVTTWTTTTSSESITLPAYTAGTYNATVYWGDGTSSTVTAWDDSDKTHTYTDAGTYTVQVDGSWGDWRSDQSSDDDTKLKTVEQWGDVDRATAYQMFYNCANVTSNATDSLDFGTATNAESMFQNADSFADSNMDSWDVSGITNMYRMFYLHGNFNNDIGSWNVSNVTNMDQMFRDATSFNQDISGWNVSSVTNMGSMFRNTPFNQDIGSWDTGAVTNMAAMFYANSAFDQDISGWDVTALTNAPNMFAAGGGLSTTNYDLLLVGWEAQAVKNNVTFHGGSACYSSGNPATARAALISDHSWTITDGGQCP